MLQGKSQTDSPERKLKVGLLALLPGAAALAVAVLLVGLAAGSTGVQAQEAGATYTGSVDVLVEATCGGGTISLTVSDDGASISQLVLDGTYVGAVLVNTLSDPAGGPFVVALDPGIAIAEDGSFSETIQPVPGVDADFQGQFEDDTVSGSFGVTALACVDVTFSATVADEETASPTPGVSLPTTGSAPAGSGDSPGLWAALAAVAGAVMLAGGLLALRRRA